MASQGSSSHPSSISGKGKGKGKRILPELPPPPPHSSDLFANHFEKLLDPITGDSKVICNYCGRLFTFQAQERYGTFKIHLNKKHYDKIRGDDESQTHSLDPAISSCSSQGSTGTHPSVFTYSYNRATKLMAKMVCAMSLPLNFTDSIIFEKFVKSYNPLAKRIPRSQLIREIRKLVTQTSLVLIKDFVKLPNKVSICADVWSDHWGRCHYIAITCRWIDDTWTLQKRLIAFKCFINDEYTAVHISRELYNTLRNYGLDKKVFSISFDHDSANMISLDSLINVCRPSISANFFHVRCINNILTLCAQDLLNILKDDVAPIRKAALCLFYSHSLTKKWATFCKKNNLLPKLFTVDLSDRWDLTCKMLSDTYEYRDALCSFFSEQKCGDILLSLNQWDACSNLRQLLKTFKDAIEELSGVYYPTSILAVDNFVKIAITFNSLIGSDGLGECANEMIVKWSKYFHEIPSVFLLAKIFDPRIRIDGLETMLEIYYDALFPIKDDKTPIPSLIIGSVKTCLYDIFQDCKIKYSDSLGLNISTCSDSDKNTIPLSLKLQNLYDKISEKRPWNYGLNPYEELEIYLTARFEYIVDAEFDILKWWSRMTMQFPIMSLIAKDILAVPASTVSAQQAFSTGGYVLEERQSKLSLRNLENQLLLGDWTNAEHRCQENDYDDADESDTISDSDDEFD